MNERDLYQVVKNTGEQLAVFTGFKPRAVDLATLLENAKSYNGKFVQTEGLYTTHGRRTVKEVSGGSGGGFLPLDIPVTQYYLKEHGVLKLTDGSDNALRLYIVNFCGVKPDQADQIAQSEYVKALPARVQGYIEQGFPDEYYLRVSRFKSLLDN